MSSENGEDEKEQSVGYKCPINSKWLERPPSYITVRQWSMTSGLENSCLPPNDNIPLLVSISETNFRGLPKPTVDPKDPGKTHTFQSALEGQVHPQSTEDPIAHGKTHSVRTCIECVKPVYVLFKSDIKHGDHIVYAGRIYDHHAIVIDVLPSTDLGDSEVRIEIVHVTNTTSGTFLALIHPQKQLGKIKKNIEVINFKKTKIMIYKYSDAFAPRSPDKIVARAIEEAFADEKGERTPFSYDLLDNNCEHFATWCVTGRKLSLQVWKISIIVEMFVKNAFRGLSDERIRNQKAHERGMICDDCFARNERLLNVERKKIENKNDVNVGDIITFSYYNFWHNAVVLEIIKATDKYVKCSIAHYNFGGLRHNTLVEESRHILLNGSTLVTKYPDSFNVYEPDEVVRRARSRLQEQMFAYFLNDSFHFTRWSKLKLMKREPTVKDAEMKQIRDP